MKKEKKSKALVEAEKKITELEAKLKDETESKNTWYHKWQERDEELNGLHAILTELGIQEYKDEYKYHRHSLSVRLFSWAMKLASK